MNVGRPFALAVLLVAASGAPVVPGAASAQAPPVAVSKAALIRQLLGLTKAAELAITVMETAIPAQRATRPEVPEEFWEEFAKRARRDMPRFIDMLIPIYDAQFTTLQLEQLVAFYESPLGRRLVEVQPVITLQSTRAGQQWGAQIGAEIGQDLRRRGIQVPPQ